MSLQVWLPLNGNTSNQGLKGLSMAGFPESWGNGKIGKCATFPGSPYYVIYNNTTELNYTDNFSFCLWVKHNYTGSTPQYAFTVGRADAGGFGYGLEISSSSSINLRFGTRIITISCPANEWHHIALTVSGTTIKVYKDGALATTSTPETLPNYSDGNGLGLGCFHYSGDIYPYYGSLNDFRIYNHCLSAKEVKEISKGLVCHYKLFNPYETGQSNKYSGTVAEGNLNNSVFTKTALENERGYNYKLTYTGTGNNMWFAINAGFYPFTAGKRYYYSCKVRCHSANFSMQLRASRSDNDWVTNMTNVVSSSLADGEWHEHVVSQVVNSTYDRSGSTVTCNPILEFYTDNLSSANKVYSADFDIKDVQVIESDCYVPFIENSMSTTKVSDCSGLGNNGTKIGGITLSTSPVSIRYESCYNFDGNTGSIQIPNLATLVPNGEFTMNCWIYHDNTWSSKPWETIFGGPSGFELEAKANSTNSPSLYAYSWGSGQAAYELNKWNMITMTRNASETKFYINGELKITGSAGTIPSGNYFIGAWNTSSQQNYKGRISDFRLYSNVLSLDDIKELYTTSASVDKNGNMYAYEFKEV